MIIKLNNLKLKTIIGVYEWEQSVLRELIINLTIHTQTHNSMDTDKLSDTIDYEGLVNQIKEITLKQKFQLIEALSKAIIDQLTQDKRITKLKLCIAKVGAVQDLESFEVVSHWPLPENL